AQVRGGGAELRPVHRLISLAMFRVTSSRGETPRVRTEQQVRLPPCAVESSHNDDHSPPLRTAGPSLPTPSKGDHACKPHITTGGDETSRCAEPSTGAAQSRVPRCR